MTDLPERHARKSILLKAELAQKLEELSSGIWGSTENSLLNALIHAATPESASAAYAKALAAGVVKNRKSGRVTEGSQVIAELAKLNPTELKAMLALVQAKNKDGGGDGAD